MSARTRIILAVTTGAGLGALARALLALPAGASAWPWPTLLANILGALLIGVYAGRIARPGAISTPPERHFVMAGICGGMTTFSVFSLETLLLLEQGEPAVAAGYTVVSLLTWLAATAAGYRLAHGGATPEQA